MKKVADLKIAVVCAGNICRSPMAEAILKDEINKRGLTWEVASRGTGSWHQGDGADPRAIETLKRHRLDASYHRAQRFSDDDFSVFDWILVMDKENLEALRSRAKNPDMVSKIHLYLELAGSKGPLREVPDPYFGGTANFEAVFQLLRRYTPDLIDRILAQE
jgi:protein-tyrosine phosphatase